MIPIHALDLVDLGCVDVEVRDELGAARKFGHVARDAIVESRAKSEQAIAIIDGVVGECGAVHAEHAHGQGIGGIDRADSHQGGDHGNLKLPSRIRATRRRRRR